MLMPMYGAATRRLIERLPPFVCEIHAVRRPEETAVGASIPLPHSRYAAFGVFPRGGEPYPEHPSRESWNFARCCIQSPGAMRISSRAGSNRFRCKKEITMGTFKLSILAVAVVVGIPVVSALAAQQFEDDCLTTPLGQTGTPVSVEVKHFGRDSVFLTKEAQILRPEPTRLTDFALRPGRA
jgi:hypothetical protein